MSVLHSPPRVSPNDGDRSDLLTPQISGGLFEESGSSLLPGPPISQEVAEEQNRQEIFAAEFRNVRLPTFWRNKPALWFVQLESEFTAYRIRSEEVKYSAVIRHLDESTMTVVSDILENPPGQDKYLILKRTLIQRLAESQEKQLLRLLSDVELVSKKPSVLIREMRNLAGLNATEGLLKTLWMQRIPNRLRELLVVLEGSSLDKLAVAADKAWELSGQSEVAETRVGDLQDAVIQRLTQQVEQLSQQVARLGLRRRSPFRSRKSFRPCQKSQSFEASGNATNRRNPEPPAMEN